MSLTLQEQLMALKQNMFTDGENKEAREDKIRKTFEINKLNYRTTNDVHSNNLTNKDVVRGMEYEELKGLRRGDVVWVDLRTNVGSEQKSDENGRPMIIIQNNIGNAHSPTIIGVCVTSRLEKPKLPTHVLLPVGNGLSKNSIVLAEQIMTLDKKRRILRKTGHIDDITMKKINKATAISIGDLQEKNTLEKLAEESRDYIISKFKFIDTCISSLDFLYKIKGDNYSIKLAEEEKKKEEDALKYFCYKNKLDYNEICENYMELEKRKEDSIAL